MALIVAGDRSGVGKTTITLAILAYLAQQGNKVQSFKVGPDYIDPMFHQAATGLPCRNLDPVLTSPSYVQACFSRHAQNANWAVIEGVMGLFDGISDVDEPNSFPLILSHQQSIVAARRGRSLWRQEEQGQKGGDKQ